MNKRPYLAAINFNKRILEIGPLINPLAHKEMGPFIYYADIRSTKELKEVYKDDPRVDCDTIKEVDFVISDTYQAALTDQGVEKFDYVLCCHVIEHVPMLLNFFHEIGSILKEGGKFCLTIPDHRYCFDHYRVPTSFAEAYDIHINGKQRIAHRILDTCMNSSHNIASRYWEAKHNQCSLAYLLNKPFESAKLKYEKALAGEFFNFHVSVFTTASFLKLLFDAIRANMLPFRISDVYPTFPNTFEFDVVLVKNSSMLRTESIRRRELQKIIVLYDKIFEFEANLRSSIE